MKKFDLVIFDLDGTILDTLPDLSAAVNDALARRGLPGHTVEEYKKMVGNGVRNLCLQALGDPSEEVLEASLRDFKNYYVSHIDEQTRPYAGMPELLRDLQQAGTAVAVASNKFIEGTRMLCARFYPFIPDGCVLGETDGLPRKPEPDMLLQLKKPFPADARCCMVGDSWTDVEAGKAARMATVGVTWGYRRTDALVEAAPDAVVEDVDALRRFFFL